MTQWTHFLTAVVVAVTILSLMNRREETNRTRYAVACETKSDKVLR